MLEGLEKVREESRDGQIILYMYEIIKNIDFLCEATLADTQASSQRENPKAYTKVS